MVRQHPQLKFVVCPQVTHYDSTLHFLHKYPLLSFRNHMAINPNLFIVFVHIFSLRLYKLSHVDQTLTYTQYPPTPLFFFLSPRYKLSDIATSALTSKDIHLFHTLILTLSIRIIIKHSCSNQIPTQLVLVNIGLPLFSLLKFTILNSQDHDSTFMACNVGSWSVLIHMATFQ